MVQTSGGASSSSSGAKVISRSGSLFTFLVEKEDKFSQRADPIRFCCAMIGYAGRWLSFPTHWGLSFLSRHQ